MALTYVKIADNILSTNTTSFSFSNIPGTYTDLLLKWSSRDTNNTLQDVLLSIRFNSSTSTIHSTTLITPSNNNTPVSLRTTNANRIAAQGGSNGLNSTSSTFSNGELYIANYTSTGSKAISIISAPERNSTTFDNYGLTATAALYRNTAAITSIDIASSDPSFALVSGSSFYLYGIKTF